MPRCHPSVRTQSLTPLFPHSLSPTFLMHANPIAVSYLPFTANLVELVWSLYLERMVKYYDND